MEAFDHVAAARKRPAMYCGGTDARGIEHLINELVSNSLDQFFHGSCTDITVSFSNEKVIVRDNGSGIPAVTDDPLSIDSYFLSHHETPSVDNHAPHVHLFSMGVGLFVVNALSAKLQVKTKVHGQVVRLDFVRGSLVAKEIEKNETDWIGTEVRFLPDPDIFKGAMPRRLAVRKMLFDAVHLFPGIAIRLDQEVFHAPEGLVEYAALLEAESRFQSAYFSMRERVGDVQVDVALAGWTESPCRYLSWANGSRTEEHGSHVEALEQAITRDPVSGLGPAIALIHVVMHDPDFAGPTRGSLRAPQIVEPIHQRLLELLSR